MSDETTSEGPAGGELDRRELLKKAGQVGAGAVAAGSLVGTAKAATKRSAATPKIKRGGRLIWGLESDPAHVAPFGGILTANHWAKEFAYDSLVEWDRNLIWVFANHASTASPRPTWGSRRQGWWAGTERMGPCAGA